MRRSLTSHFERLRKVCADVVYVLDADADANHILAHAARRLLRLRQLLVRGARRVNDQSLGVAHVGELAGELDGVDELGARAQTPLDAKSEHRAVGILAEVFVGAFVVRVVGKSRA